MDWYYAKNSQKIGPVEKEDIQELWDNGEINLETLVWHEGLTEWLPLKEHDEHIDLDSKLTSPPTLPQDGQSELTFENFNPAWTYFLRRGVAWGIDVFIVVMIVGILSLYTYSLFQEDGEQFIKDYFQLASGEVIDGDENIQETTDEPANQSDQQQGSLTEQFLQNLQQQQQNANKISEKYPSFQYWQMGITFIFWIIYDTLLMVYLGGSIGKKITSLRVTNKEGHQVTFYNAFSKSITRVIVTLFVYLIPISAVLVFITRPHRSLSDLLPKTLVLPDYLVKKD